MTTNATHLIAACLALVLLASAVGARLLFTRVQEMRSKRIHPQVAATSVQMAARLENVQAADNFRSRPVVGLLRDAARARGRLSAGMSATRSPLRRSHACP